MKTKSTAAPLDFPTTPMEALEVVEILVRAYVPKNTTDARTGLAALNVLRIGAAAAIHPEPTGKRGPMRHEGECANDELAQQVCEDIFKERCDDNLALCEALRAVYTLCGESKDVAQIVHDAIRKHGIESA